MKLLILTPLCFVFGSLSAQAQIIEDAPNQTERSVVITANFIANKTTVCVGETVQFTDNSTGSPNTWAWQFAGGSPASATAQNPAIQYNLPGTYNVVLTASNGSEQNTVGKLSFIRVEACTGFDINSIESGILVFPVPATNFLNIQSKNDADFTVMSLSGQVLQSGAVLANQTLVLKTSSFAPGIYFLRTVSSGTSSVSKIIIE